MPDAADTHIFPFRPWVRRAGLSIVLVAVGITATILFILLTRPSSRYGWFGEPFVWVYVGTLWLGGLKVWLGTRKPVAETGPEGIVLRPLHQIGARRIGWDAVLGTEQMIGGDRLIIYHHTRRGMRFVALNLNLVKGRKDLLGILDARLRTMGCIEKTVDRSRYLSRPGVSKQR